MDDTNRVLGALTEFKENTISRLDKIETKVDTLTEWKWRIIGGASALSAIVAFIITLLKQEK